MRLSKADYDALMKKRLAPKSGVERWQALGRLPKDQMNGTERAFSEWLDAEIARGRVLDYRFHPMRVRLADNAYYEVDFLALMADMSLTIFETKGTYTSEKGQLKIRLCAEVLPYFKMVKATKLPKKEGGGWKFEEF